MRVDFLPSPMIVRFCNPHTITVSAVFWWLIFPVFGLGDNLGKEFLSLTLDPLEGTREECRPGPRLRPEEQQDVRREIDARGSQCDVLLDGE